MQTNLNELKPISELERIQAQMNQGQMLQNVAVIPDGIELAFQGDKCGKSYRIKKDICWRCYFYDWHDGWLEINRWPGERLRGEAIDVCNRHAVEKRLIKFLPNRPKFKPNPNLWGGWGGIAAAATSAGLGAFGL